MIFRRIRAFSGVTSPLSLLCATATGTFNFVIASAPVNSNVPTELGGELLFRQTQQHRNLCRLSPRIVQLILTTCFRNRDESMARRITRRALGRSGQLGDLYDAHNDEFLTGNIFDNQLPASVVLSEDSRDVTFKFDRQNNYSSTFNNLNMEAELKLNILSGILNVDGHGKYMTNISKSSGSHKITLSLFINRKTRRPSSVVR